MVMTSGSFSLMNNFKLFQLEQTGNDSQFQHLICTCFGQKAVFKTVLLKSSKLQIFKASKLQLGLHLLRLLQGGVSLRHLLLHLVLQHLLLLARELTEDCVEKCFDLSCLNKLEDAHGRTEVLLGLVAVGVFCQRLGGLGNISSRSLDLGVLAVHNVLDKLHVICPHSHLEAFCCFSVSCRSESSNKSLV